MPAETPEASATRAPRAALWTATTYFAEGLPWSILHQIAAEFFTALGLPARQVGYTSALHLTSTLKFAWSPLVDLFGTLRRWMIATQAAMGIVVAVIALLADSLLGDPGGTGTGGIWLALIVLGILSATHDIACDGYYMDALGRADQARFSGIRVAAFRVAMLVGSSALVYLGGRVSWPLAFAIAALLLAALALFHRGILPRHRREPAATTTRAPAEALASKSNPKRHDLKDIKNPGPTGPLPGARAASHVAAAYLSFLRQPQAFAVIAFIITFKLGDALMFSMSKVLFRDLGVMTATRGLLNGFGTAASITGAIAAGAWMARAGLPRALAPIALAMAASEPLYLLLAAQVAPLGILEAAGAPHLLLAHLEPATSTVGVILVIEQLLGGMATAAQMVFIMRRCHPDHKAAHFAFATALFALAQTISGTYSGILYETHGALAFFAVACLACAPCLLLLPWVTRDQPSPESR